MTTGENSNDIQWLKACFIRGGTSKGVFFTAADLPANRAERDALFCAMMGSPDPNGRQLDGMGGGISSLSKVMIVETASDDEHDLAYTFAQVAVDSASVDYSANCGNLSSAIAPFALETGLLTLPDGEHAVRLLNTNTSKTVITRLTVVGGHAQIHGDFALPGVAGTGAPITLEYPDPAGSRTSGLLPTGNATDIVHDEDGDIEVSLVDACLPMVFVRASDINADPTQLSFDGTEVMARLERIRAAGAKLMGMEPAQAAPKIAVVAPPTAAPLLDGTQLEAEGHDVLVRTLSMQKTHKAVPGTGAMCIAAAASIEGSIIAEAIGSSELRSVRIGTPSGAVTAGARYDGNALAATQLVRSARILMRGEVAVP
ncbi:PrpF domain-containing protein [Corynebacterium sp. SA-MJD20WY100]|uniref:PrpF domain-containing protein n=1 Tax=Corynebacterium sp. SA-MJD20WY100 TaxID=3142969 RepID=UPI003221C447